MSSNDTNLLCEQKCQAIYNALIDFINNWGGFYYCNSDYAYLETFSSARENLYYNRLNELGDNKCNITISEGKFHQVKRMFESVGCKVTYLKRISIGNITLDPSLKEGEYIEIDYNKLLC